MRIVHLATLAAAGLAVAALAGVGLPEPASGLVAAEGTDTITVTGSGVATTVPDRAEFLFGVVTEARTARAALSANSEQATRVIAALESAGVAKDDLQTQEVSLSPRYDDAGTAIVGYTAQNTVSAALRSLGRAGAVVDAAVTAGANSVAGPALTRSDQTELYRSALRAAVDDARAKAGTLAAAAGVALGQVAGMVEGEGSEPVLVPRSGAMAADVPVEPGAQRIDATVTVTFTIA
jgi:uncharacterized protein